MVLDTVYVRRVVPAVPVVFTLALALAAAGGRPALGATPAALTVNSTADLPDAGPGDGVCRTAKGTCTLRAAVMEADAGTGPVKIKVPAGHFRLTIPPRLGKARTDFTLKEPGNGSLKILVPATIVGAGRNATVVDGGGLDRVFTVTSPAAITDLTVTGGSAAPTATPYNYYGGGGVLNTSDLVMERVHVTRNTATFGGGIFNIPFSSFTLRDGLVDGNTAGEAGGIRFDWDGLVERSTITRNRVVNPHDAGRPGELAGLGGGIDVRGPGIELVDTRVTRNSASDGGGGINITLAYLPDPGAALSAALAVGHVRLKNSVVTGNARGDCRAVFARFVSLGGNTGPVGPCHLDQPTDHPR